MAYTQSQNELRTHLGEQVDFLLASAAAYDGGSVHEAKRLAIHIRTLVHASRSSVPLLRQLDTLASIALLDTCGDLNISNALACSRLICLYDGRYVAILDLKMPWCGWKSFEQWWNQSVVADGRRNLSLNRREVVLAVADQDGGAHVDPELRDEYAEISRGKFGWMEVVDGVAYPIRPLHLACVRQVAHEVLRSLQKYDPGLLSDEIYPVRSLPRVNP